MVIDILESENTEVIFLFMPMWEMSYSMHVIGNPKHHPDRKEWVATQERDFPELVKKVRELQNLTHEWTFIIDSDIWREVRQMEVLEIIAFFKKKNIYEWNDIIKYYGMVMTIKERNAVLNLMEEYYGCIFKKEEVILKIYVTQALREEKKECEKGGVWNWCKKVHVRLEVDENTLVFLKNREYRFEKNDIHMIFVTVSTFCSPHLWFYQRKSEIEIVKAVEFVRNERGVPEDLMSIFKALGDMTRLQIIRNLMQGTNTTQELAKRLNLTEAAVSKHLKILSDASLVSKKRSGYFVEYTFHMETIDYIPCMFYETMIKK